jgi:hypothetical protein
MPELPNPTRGLLIDGIMASEAVDSSGEVLDVKGADVSSMTVDGVLNYEHKGDQDKASSFDDVIGRCIKCKKIYSLADCANDREKMYWGKVELPFIYTVFRLFDESEHLNARAAAAIIRDQHAAGEPLILRFSVEGSTIEKEGNVLKHTIARRCALTIKPANKSAFTGLLHDPKAPKDESPENSDLLAGLADDAKKFEHPGFTRLQNNDFVYIPFEDDVMAQVLAAQREVRKATEAGNYNVAQHNLSSGAALQVEDLGKGRIYAVCKAAVRDWDMVKHPNFKKYLAELALSQGLGEMSDDFLDMFNELAYEVHVSKRNAGLQKGEDEEGDEVQVEGGKPHGVGHPKYKVPKKDPEEYKNPFGIKREKHNTDTSYYRAVAQATYDRNLARIKDAGSADDSFDFGANRAALPPSEQTGEPEGRPEEMKRGAGFFDPRTGWLHTPVRSYKAYAPNPGEGEAFEDYLGIMNSPDVQRVHDTAIRHWMVVHNLAKQGKLPDSLVASSALNSMMSPNCSVFVQEATDGHLWDMMRRGWDPRKAIDPSKLDTIHRQFLAFMENNPEAANPEDLHERNGKLNVLPVFMREHYDAPESQLWLKDDPDTRIKMGFQHQRWAWATKYHLLHDHLNQLVKEHGTDARSAALSLMNLKAQQHSAKADPSKPDVEGLAPKTGRYTLGMLGMGNAVVNDTHFIRHIFGMMSPDPRIDDLKATLNRPRNEHMLQGMDQWFMKNHPAFKHTVEKVHKDYGVDLGDQATFLAFWLHWLTIGKHETHRGWGSDASNEATDHMVFWNHAQNILKEEGIPWTDFRKSEEGIHEHERPLMLRASRAFHSIEHNFGYTPATFIWYSHIVPHLLAHSEEHQSMTKHERLAMGVLAMAALVKGEGEEEKPSLQMFKGKAVQPGVVRYSMGGDFPLVNVGKQFHHVLDSDGMLTRMPAGRCTVIKPPKVVRANTRVDAMKHGVPHLAESDHQRDLLEGVDMAKRLGHPDTKGQTAKRYLAQGVEPVAGWYESEAGRRGYVKPSREMDGHLSTLGTAHPLNSAHREAIFHSMAEKFFGLGEHVPVTAAFQHPVTNETHSIQEEVKGEHYKKRDPMHESVLMGNLHSGTLDKLALMDMVMNHSDRHVGNFMLSPDGAQVHLIDNGLVFAPSASNYTPAVPYYWDRAASLMYGQQEWPHEPLHPEAERWLQGLDPGKFDQHMTHMGVPPKLRKEAVRRLIRLKERVERGGATKGSAFFAPFMSKTKSQPATENIPFMATDPDDEPRNPFAGR